MEPPRFYCPVFAPGLVTLDAGESRHARRSLRLRPGDDVVLFDGCGRIATGTLAGSADVPASGAPARSRRGDNAVRVAVTDLRECARPACSLTLLVAACKGPRLDWLVEKCTELGVSRLVLTRFEHSVVHPGPQHIARLRRTTIEACKQCGRAWLPVIDGGIALADALARVSGSTLLVAHPDADAAPLGPWIAAHQAQPGNLAVVIGPEGGLSSAELAALQSAGGQLVRLAQHTLRIETAALAVAAVWAASAEIA